ncbi:MAG: electron transport complex subunit RsxB [Burkholderiales bacterium]|nr:electron transport complex subunit RsxB [Burkholderiales bacterium]
MPRTATPATGVASLAQRLDALLPQTQCTRCGYPDCRSYADALAAGEARLNQCPPGGAEGIRRLARELDQPELPLDPAFGDEAPRRIVYIEEATCIGCTLCIQACPVDAIVGAPKRMHAVIEADCTGCELCLPVCPMDCIALEETSAGATGWDAWSRAQADTARDRFARRQARLARDVREHDERLSAPAQAPDVAAQAAPEDPKRAAVAAALARARLRAQGRAQ